MHGEYDANVARHAQLRASANSQICELVKFSNNRKMPLLEHHDIFIPRWVVGNGAVMEDFRGAVKAGERRRKELERNAKWMAEHAQEWAEKKAKQLPLLDCV